jgi:adenosylmethionine-8-amino-7-oxononanoate aminotransferase
MGLAVRWFLLIPHEAQSLGKMDFHMTAPVPQHIHSTSDLPKVAWAKGSYLYDVNGKQYIDGSGGPAVYSIGHANAEVNAAITAQLERIAHGYRYNFTTDALEELTEIIATNCGGTLRHMVYVTGGSEAVESCMKLALQYHAVREDMSRRRFIARQRSWHGNTLGALSISGFKERTAAFEGSMLEASHISPANDYRPIGADNAAACAQELEDEILRVGAHNVAAFIFEPVVGAAGGCVPAPVGYAKLVRAICDKYGVLMIADEVMCGVGRCGPWRALAFDGVEPDIMSVAKGLAAGYLPLGAAIYNDKIAAVVGAPMTGHTFTGHTACCAAGVAVQKIIMREGLLARVQANESKIKSMIADATSSIDAIGDIRGRGHFIAVELVENRATKKPFDGSHKLYMHIRQRALENGLVCYPSGGNVDGVNGDIVMLAPPYNSTDDELSEMVDKMAVSIREILSEKGLGS